MNARDVANARECSVLDQDRCCIKIDAACRLSRVLLDEDAHRDRIHKNRRSPSGPRRGPHMAMTRHRHRIDPASVSFLSSSGSRSFLSQPSAFRARCASIRTRSRVRS